METLNMRSYIPAAEKKFLQFLVLRTILQDAKLTLKIQLHGAFWGKLSFTACLNPASVLIPGDTWEHRLYRLIPCKVST